MEGGGREGRERGRGPRVHVALGPKGPNGLGGPEFKRKQSKRAERSRVSSIKWRREGGGMGEREEEGRMGGWDGGRMGGGREVI